VRVEFWAFWWDLLRRHYIALALPCECVKKAPYLIYIGTLCQEFANFPHTFYSGTKLRNYSDASYIQGGPKKVSHYQGSSINRIKSASTATFLITFEYKISKRMLLVCIKYSTCDLIRDVISCCVWSCDMGEVKCIWQNHDLKPEEKMKYGNQRNFYINIHLIDGLDTEFTAF